ncbi:MAG TPA: hypothetical protein PK166_00375 [Candidatus Hydrogenedentes bacterium]|nr:hypothetical protein [Candidatus Hydrogenedentota bacterium]
MISTKPILQRRTAMAALAAAMLVLTLPPANAAEPIDIGSRLEPLWDQLIIESMDGVRQLLHEPVPRDIALTTDAPWEGNISCYFTVFEDDGLFRMYYRGSHFDLKTNQASDQRVCYAVSVDGIHWTKPELGLFQFDGSSANNIVWEGEGVHNFSPFKDGNPACPPEERYKAVASGHDEARLLAFKSADAVHWELIRETPIITVGAFDSHNLAFWDACRQQYVEYHRGFTDGVRAIMTSTTRDFLNWPEPQWLQYTEGTPAEHLYTNGITPYHRAPHIFIGFPKRFRPDRDLNVHHYPGVSDGLFMTSRDGLLFHRWREAFLRPGPDPTRWVNRNNMIAWGVMQTDSRDPNRPPELSIYATEGYYVGPCELRRHTIRLDGFVSVNAPATGGTFTTKPLLFADGEDAPLPERAAASLPLSFTQDNPIRGGQSLVFTSPQIVKLPNTQHLGAQATFAAVVRDVPAGHRRIFSAYDGGGIDAMQNELIFDCNPAGKIGDSETGFRFYYNTRVVETPAGAVPPWTGDSTPHHLAATYDDGVMCLYFDGKEVARSGEPGFGPIELRHGDLQFGEDYPPAAVTNEPFIGVADDILVVRRVLSPEEIQRLAAEGAAAVFGDPASENGILYTAENDEGAHLTNAFTGGDAELPVRPETARTKLLINYATSAGGSIWCEIQDASGNPIPGFTLADCDEIYGDHIERVVTWGGKAELSALVGTPIRLHVKMSDADLYAIRFR